MGLGLRSLHKELLAESAEASAYDYYIQRDPTCLQRVLIEDYNKIGIITSFQEVEFASDEEYDLDLLGEEDDSNAEDYYANDYPEDDYDDSEDESGTGRGRSAGEEDGFGDYHDQDQDEDEDDYELALWRRRFSLGRSQGNTSDSDRWLHRSVFLPSDEEAVRAGEVQ